MSPFLIEIYKTSQQETIAAGFVSEELSWHDLQLFCRNGLDRIPVKC